MSSAVDSEIEPGTVVVGLDWSHGARGAVEYAVRDAARRGVGVDVITVFEPLKSWAWAYLGVDDVSVDDGAALSSGRGLVAEVTAAVESELGSAVPTATVHVRHGRPGEVVVEAAREAAVLVVGHRGSSRAAGAVLGSVGLHCVLHATCPVTVVRSRAGSDEDGTTHGSTGT